MPLQLYKCAILTADLRAGDICTIVHEHIAPGVAEKGYSVEFVDMTGRAVAVITVATSALREPTPADRPSVREMTGAKG